jgi:type IX secretion system PorP/SprF family membrane protein
MKHVFTYMALLCLSANVFAQQDPQFTNFNFNRTFFNPAYAGVKRALCFTAMARNQWSGFEGAPKTATLTGEYWFDNISSAVGGSVMIDQLGFEKNMSYRGIYSFHMESISGGNLSFGLDAGFTTKILGPTGSQSWISSSPWQNDPSIPPQIKKTSPDFGAGVWYQHPLFWFGASASHIGAPEMNQGNVTVNATPPSIHSRIYQVARHYWITGGYNFQKRDWLIQPSFLVKSDATITSFDVNMVATYNNSFWLGATYRHKDAICPQIGFTWQSGEKKSTESATTEMKYDPRRKKKEVATWKIGFAYDYTTSKLNDYNNGTFEVFLNYCIPVAPWIQRQGCSRLFE